MEDQIRRQNNPKLNDDPASLLYEPVERLFGLYMERGTTVIESSIEPIYYCPFCGTKLPTWLGENEEYAIALEKAIGYDGYKALLYEHPKTHAYCLDRDKIPEEFKEFKTDEWWIKRGL